AWEGGRSAHRAESDAIARQDQEQVGLKQCIVPRAGANVGRVCAVAVASFSRLEYDAARRAHSRGVRRVGAGLGDETKWATDPKRRADGESIVNWPFFCRCSSSAVPLTEAVAAR